MRPAAGGQAQRHEGEEWLQSSPELGWRLRPGFRGMAFGAPRAFGVVGLLSEGSLPSNRRRRRPILLLGDSRAFGIGVRSEESFAALLQRQLPEREIVNLGVPGYSSFQGVTALRLYGSRLSPEVVVFAFGFNDRRYERRAEDADSARRFRRMARRAAWVRLARSLALVDLLAGRNRREEEERAHLLDLATVVPRVSPDAYRANLEAAVDYCAARRIRLFFLLFHDNPEETRPLVRGLGRLRRGRLAVAERELRAAVALKNSFSDAARLSLAHLYEQTGRRRAAQQVRVSPRTLFSLSGGYPIFANGEYEAIAFQVASEHGIEVVPAGRVIDEHPEWYFNFCHFNREGHRAVADLLFAALSTPRPRQGD